MVGWIKLHRKIRSNPIFNDPQLLRLWLICLTEASHTEHDQIVGRQTVKLKPGDFVTGRFALMDMYNTGLKSKDRVKGEKTIFRWLEQLQEMGYLTIKKTNKFSIVSIDNWAIYQDGASENDNSLTIKRPSKDHQMTTNKNVKNDKNKKKINNSRHKYEPCDMENANLLYQKILENNPQAKKPNLEKWASDFRLIRQIDKRTDEQVKYLIGWTQQDTFWKANILSPARLRKQFDHLVVKIKSSHEAAKRKTAVLNEKEFDLTDD